YMRELFDEYRGTKKKKRPVVRKNSRRRPVSRKTGGKQERDGHGGYTANLFHDDIQQALYEQLCDEFSPENVLMEGDWVGLLVNLPDKVILYEVKSARYAVDCMLQGIGQALGYAFRVQQFYKKSIELVIAGPNLPSEIDFEVMEFI